jgi:hypothetical protein
MKDKKMNYYDMYKKFIDGQITTDEWIAFCRDYFNNVIMADPEIIDVMKRLKNK